MEHELTGSSRIRWRVSNVQLARCRSGYGASLARCACKIDESWEAGGGVGVEVEVGGGRTRKPYRTSW